MEQLQQRRRDLPLAISALGFAAKRAQNSEEAAARKWVLNQDLSRKVVLIYKLADYTAAPAVVFLRGVCRQRDWGDNSDDEIRTFVVNEFLNSDGPYSIHLADLENLLDVGAMRVALDYVGRRRVASWAAVQNLQIISAVDVPDAKPTLAQVQQIFGRHCGSNSRCLRPSHCHHLQHHQVHQVAHSRAL